MKHSHHDASSIRISIFTHSTVHPYDYVAMRRTLDRSYKLKNFSLNITTLPKKMTIACRHGDGWIVLTDEQILVYVVHNVIQSSSTFLTPSNRSILEGRFLLHPPPIGKLTMRQVEASLHISYGEDEHYDDCSIGTDDTWSSVEENEFTDDESD